MAAGLISLRPLEPADAPALLELRVRNRAFLEPWEPVRDEFWYTLEAQRADIAAGIEGRAPTAATRSASSPRSSWGGSR